MSPVRVRQRSKWGCQNCKLRRVKCDESKPICQQCRAYGVSCSFISIKADLQLQPNLELILRPQAPIELPLWPHPTDELINRFQLQVAPTMSYGNRLDIYTNQVLRLAQSTPFLRHAIVTTALMYQRHTNTLIRSNPTVVELYHWDQALGGFNRKLSQNPQVDDKAALLSASMLLWLLEFCHIDALTPEESWPISPCVESGPTWLKIARGKEEVWRQMPSPPQDCISAALAPVEQNPIIMQRTERLPAQGVPVAFLRLFLLHRGRGSWESTSVYYNVAVDVAWALFTDQVSLTTILSFVTFLSGMSPVFRTILMAKDPRALLLLACWYGAVHGLGVWWMTPRAKLEGQAICRYLERRYPDNPDLLEMVVFIRRRLEESY